MLVVRLSFSLPYAPVLQPAVMQSMHEGEHVCAACDSCAAVALTLILLLPCPAAGEMQSGLAAALEGSRTAVATSQEVRSAMVEHVTRLDAAALLIWQGGQGQGQQIGLA